MENQWTTTRKVVFGLSIVLGILVQYVGAQTSITKEAWDNNSFYFPALFCAGFIAGLFGQGKPWMWYWGIYIGQTVYLICYSITIHNENTGVNLLPLGLLIMLFVNLLALIGAWLGGLVMGMFTRKGDQSN